MNEIYKKFEKIAISLIKKGFKHYSADGIAHVVRFHTAINSGGEYKINNNDVAELSRQFLRDHPECEGFFQLRRSKADQSKLPFNESYSGEQYEQK